METKFRFGVISNGTNLKKWQYQIIEYLINEGHTFTLSIQAISSKSNSKSKSKFAKYFNKNGLYHFYLKRMDNRAMLLNMSLEKLISPNTQVMHIEAIEKGKYSQYMKESDVERIKEKELDFILRFGMNIIRGEVLNAAKLGVWSFHHDDEEIIRGGPPGFWEIFHRHSHNGVMLQQLTNKLDGGRIIKKAKYPIIYHSYKTHLNELLAYSIDLFKYAIENLVAQEKLQWVESRNHGVKIYKAPTNLQMIHFVLKLISNRISFNINDLFFHEKWTIGVIDQSIEQLMKEKKLRKVTFHSRVPKNSFYADPFAIAQKEHIRLFFENYSYKTLIGKISTISFNKESHQFGEVHDLIEEPYHLAFPFILKRDQEIFILPETSISGKQWFYRYDLNTNTAKKQDIFIEKDCVDAIVFQHEGLEWLFCGLKTQLPNTLLFAYYRGDAKNGLWTPHQQNPIISDARGARMAGPIIKYNGSLIRFSQKNNLYYGEGIRVNRIIDLSPTCYKEEELFLIDASSLPKYNRGMHSIFVCQKHIVIDAKRYSTVFSELIRKFSRKLSKS